MYFIWYPYTWDKATSLGGIPEVTNESEPTLILHLLFPKCLALYSICINLILLITLCGWVAISCLISQIFFLKWNLSIGFLCVSVREIKDGCKFFDIYSIERWGYMFPPLESRESSGMVVLWLWQKQCFLFLFLETFIWEQTNYHIKSPTTLYHHVVRKPKPNEEAMEARCHIEKEKWMGVKRRHGSGPLANSMWIIDKLPGWAFPKFLTSKTISKMKWLF